MSSASEDSGEVSLNESTLLQVNIKHYPHNDLNKMRCYPRTQSQVRHECTLKERNKEGRFERKDKCWPITGISVSPSCL